MYNSRNVVLVAKIMKITLADFLSDHALACQYPVIAMFGLYFEFIKNDLCTSAASCFCGNENGVENIVKSADLPTLAKVIRKIQSICTILIFFWFH